MVLDNMDYPLGKSAPSKHPGKRFVQYLVVSRARVYQEAPVKCDPDRITKEDIITDILSKLLQEGGMFKQMDEDGEWSVVKQADARRKVSGLFSDHKAKRKKKQLQKEQERDHQQIAAGEPPNVCGESFASLSVQESDIAQSAVGDHSSSSIIDRRSTSQTTCRFPAQESQVARRKRERSIGSNISTGRTTSARPFQEEYVADHDISMIVDPTTELLEDFSMDHDSCSLLSGISFGNESKVGAKAPTAHQDSSSSFKKRSSSFSQRTGAVSNDINESNDGCAKSTEQDSFAELISLKVSSISLRERSTISSLASCGKPSWKDMFRRKPNLPLSVQDEISLLGDSVRSIDRVALKTVKRNSWVLNSIFFQEPNDPKDGPAARQYLLELLELGRNEDDVIFQSASGILETVLRILGRHLGVSVQHLACDVIGMVCMHPNATISSDTSGRCTLAVIRIMESHASIAEIQATCCRALGSLASLSYDNQLLVVGEHAIRMTLAAMSLFCHDANVQRCGCYMLESMTQGHHIHGHNLFNLGGVKAIHQAMRRYPDDEAIQRHSCMALSSMTCVSPEMELITINLVLAAMGLHRYDAEVQCSACCCIRALENGACNGTLPAVLDAMKCHYEVPSVQLRGIEAIEAMCGRPNVDFTPAASSECLCVVIITMKLHSGVLDMQRAAVAAIGALYARPQQSSTIGESCECIRLVFTAMDACPGDIHSVQYRGLQAITAIGAKCGKLTANTCTSEELAECAHVVIAALSRFSRVDSLFWAFATNEATTTIRSGSVHYLSSVGSARRAIAASNASKAIESIASIGAECTQPHGIFTSEDSKERLLGVVVALMAAHVDNSTVQKSCLRSLRHLATLNELDETNTIIAKEGGIKRTLLAMYHLDEDAVVQCLGCDIIAAITHLHPINQGLVANDPCFSVIPKVMQKHISDSNVQINACKVIENTACYRINHAIIIEAACIPATLNTMRTYETKNPTVQWHACRALLALAQGDETARVLLASSSTDIQPLLERAIAADQNDGFRRPCFKSLWTLLSFSTS